MKVAQGKRSAALGYFLPTLPGLLIVQNLDLAELQD
jgi:hypothetical protein